MKNYYGIITFWQNEKNYKDNIPRLCKDCEFYDPREKWCDWLTYEDYAFWCKKED